MPPRYLRKRSPEKLKPCQERMVEACDITPADQCCGVVPCSLCLEWETYADGISYGSANFATSSWTGTVAGISFVSYWQRNESGECEYIVTLNGEEVYRATCYDGASCRNPHGEVAVSTGYLEGTLRWYVYEPRELELITDPDTGCKDFFCGGCRCTADCLCVTVTEQNGTVTTGEICDIAYQCDPPLWSGVVGEFDISLQLARAEDGSCAIVATVDGVEQSPVAVAGCADLSASIVLPDYTTIDVFAKKCSCDEPAVYPCECRRDGDVWLATKVGGTSTCLIDSPPLSYSDPTIVPLANRAWNDGDCVFGAPITYKITAFPPLCVDPDTSHFLVFVQKWTTTDTPFIDNDIVRQNEWYAVVYDDTTWDIIGISYEYGICCKNDTPTNAATSHLIWVEWRNLPFGGDAAYTVKMTNTNAVIAYGDCT